MFFKFSNLDVVTKKKHINKIAKQYYIIYTISSLKELRNTCEISVLK